jgi:hypothetical protein
MDYRTDAIIGTIDEPTVINFATVSRYADGVWYDLMGRKYDKRPQQRGVYIFNGQKIIIK